MNVAWAIDDFTVENGAARAVPGSVNAQQGSERVQDYPEAVPLTCPASQGARRYSVLVRL